MEIDCSTDDLDSYILWNRKGEMALLILSEGLLDRTTDQIVRNLVLHLNELCFAKYYRLKANKIMHEYAEEFFLVIIEMPVKTRKNRAVMKLIGAKHREVDAYLEPYLISASHDMDSEVVFVATVALNDLHTSSATKELIRLAGSRNEAVRAEALKGLSQRLGELQKTGGR